jgi:hypothetical protein
MYTLLACRSRLTFPMHVCACLKGELNACTGMQLDLGGINVRDASAAQSEGYRHSKTEGSSPVGNLQLCSDRTCAGDLSTPALSRSELKGDPDANSTRPSLHSSACSNVHSDWLVGLDRGKMMGRP